MNVVSICRKERTIFRYFAVFFVCSVLCLMFANETISLIHLRMLNRKDLLLQKQWILPTNSFCIAYVGEFDDILDRSNSNSLSDSLEDIHIMYKDFRSSSVLESNGSTPPEKHEMLLEVKNLILKTPSESTLIRDLSLTIKEKDNLLVRYPLSPYSLTMYNKLSSLFIKL